MVYKNSPVWTISTDDLVAHLKTLSSPDQLYWDARELKKSFQKFQNLDWSNFPRATKIDGAWTFIN